ncbi:MAG: PorP/SprF family type IX secretion system membrane protein [Crocinitomicaceae bacterium]
MKNSILIIASLFVLSTYGQQDKHYSMFFANPVQFNPAVAGHFGGNVQLFANYRSQWFTVSDNPFRSFSASIDGKLGERQLKNGFVGAGMNIMNDVSGDSRYSLTVISAPINYSLEVNRNSYFSLGIQPGLYMQKMSGDQLYFDNQWDGSGFNSAIASNENLGGFNDTKFDLGAGLYFTSSPSSNSKYQLGVSASHLTRQPINFLQSSEKLYRNFSLYARGEFGSNGSNVAFHPAIIAFMQGPNYEVMFGNNFVYQLRPPSKHTMYFDGTSIGFGVYYRWADALVANMVFTTGAFSAGVSYDLNISGLSPATKGVGGCEFFVKLTPTLGSNKFGAPRIH